MSLAKKNGRPGLKCAIVSVRLPEAVYDAYIRRAAKRNIHVRTQLRLTLTANADRDGMTAKEARSHALALLLLADDLDRKAGQATRGFRSPKLTAVPA